MAAESSGGPTARPSHWLMAAGIYCFFAVFLIWPILQIVYTGFADKQGHFTTEYLRLIFTDPTLVAGLRNATILSICVTTLTALIALPLAILTTKYEFPGRKLLSGLLLIPLILPPFVGAIGMRLVLGRFGPLSQLLGLGDVGFDWLGSSTMLLGFLDSRLLGIACIQALGLYPIMLVNLQAALANIDPAMEQAAANLGASRWRVFRKITLPLMRPGLFAGCTLVLIWSFTELGTPLMFDFYVITPVQVFKQITEVSDNPLPYALVVVMLLASTGLYLIGKLVLGRQQAAATTKGGTASALKVLSGWRGAAATAAISGVFCLAVVPHLSVVLTSISTTGAWYKSLLPASLTSAHFVDALSNNLVLPSIRNSLQYASIATVLASIIGLGIAILLVRSRIPGKGVLDALAMLPLAVPGLVLAFGYLSISVLLRAKFPEQTGVNGSLKFLNVQEYPVVLLILSYAARRLPYIVRSAVAGLQQTPVDLELAAANLGARRSTVLFRITVPLILANLIAGALLAFSFAMLEVSDSLILVQRAEFYPITKAIWELTGGLGDGMYIASALGVWAMVLLALTILASNELLGKRMGAMFRA